MKKTIILKTNKNSFHTISVNNIEYIQTSGNYTCFFLNNKKKYIVYTSLKNTINLINDKSLIKIRNNTLININYIKKIYTGKICFVELSNGKIFHPSFRLKKELKDIYLKQTTVIGK